MAENWIMFENSLFIVNESWENNVLGGDWNSGCIEFENSFFIEKNNES